MLTQATTDKSLPCITNTRTLLAATSMLPTPPWPLEKEVAAVEESTFGGRLVAEYHASSTISDDYRRIEDLSLNLGTRSKRIREFSSYLFPTARKLIAGRHSALQAARDFFGHTESCSSLDLCQPTSLTATPLMFSNLRPSVTPHHTVHAA